MLKYNDVTIKYRTANILNCRATFYKYGSSGKNYQQAFNFRALVDCSSQGNLKKLKEATLSLVKKQIF